MEYNYDWFANDLDEPYTTAADKPFGWLGRMRVVGGRTNVWGRQSYRLSDLDLKARSHDGYGDDWPLSYKDLEPYYDVVEDYVGISGQAEGVPELPDGRFHPAMPMTCGEMQMRTRVKQKLGRTVTIGRTANITRPINGRQACHYCGPCERGCVTHSYFNSAFTTVADALNSGNCTLIPNAMVYKVLVDAATGKATGVLYIDRNTREPVEVSARAVVLCAQSLESTRILLNSATRQHPAGLANSSGVLGHYLMDHHASAGASGALPPPVSTPQSVGGAQRPNGVYVIRFRNTLNGPQQKDFIRGYGFQGGGGTRMNWGAPGFGEAYKAAIRQPVGYLNLGGFGEALARFENRVELDPAGTVDAFGIPVLRVEMTWSDNELAMMKDMAATAAEMLEAAGASDIVPSVQDGGTRLGHPRSRARAHGSRPEDIRPQPVLPGARHEEPVRHGCVLLRLDRLPEPDTDDHGDCRSLHGLSDAGDEGGDDLRTPNAQCRMHNAECRTQNAGRRCRMQDVGRRDFSRPADADARALRPRCPPRSGTALCGRGRFTAPRTRATGRRTRMRRR